MECNVPRLASKPVHAQQPYILSPCLQPHSHSQKEIVSRFQASRFPENE